MKFHFDIPCYSVITGCYQLEGQKHRTTNGIDLFTRPQSTVGQLGIGLSFNFS